MCLSSQAKNHCIWKTDFSCPVIYIKNSQIHSGTSLKCDLWYPSGNTEIVLNYQFIIKKQICHQHVFFSPQKPEQSGVCTKKQDQGKHTERSHSETPKLNLKCYWNNCISTTRGNQTQQINSTYFSCRSRSCSSFPWTSYFNILIVDECLVISLFAL